MTLKLLVKRGALLAAANWPAVAIQLVAETTFQVLLVVPVIGAAILVAVVLGGDLADLLQGGIRDMFTTIASALMSEPVALIAFICAFFVVLLGGSVFMFLVKGGTVDVLVAANEARPIEREPITYESLHSAARFTLDRFMRGCSRLFRPYLKLGLGLMAVYAVSGALYLGFVVYGYRMAAGRALIIGWTLVAAVAAGGLIGWITIVNFAYLLLQIVIAIEGVHPGQAARLAVGFVRSEFRDLAAVFLVILGVVIAATFASALAWSGVGLIAFVPLVGLAVFPLQIAALVVRGLVFEYIGLTALGAYVTLYRGYVARRSEALGRTPVASSSPLGSPA